MGSTTFNAVDTCADKSAAALDALALTYDEYCQMPCNPKMSLGMFETISAISASSKAAKDVEDLEALQMMNAFKAHEATKEFKELKASVEASNAAAAAAAAATAGKKLTYEEYCQGSFNPKMSLELFEAINAITASSAAAKEVEDLEALQIRNAYKADAALEITKAFERRHVPTLTHDVKGV